MPKRALVVGAGTMGAGIAHVCALHGFETTLQDVSKTQLEKAKAQIQSNVEKGVSLGKVKKEDQEGTLSRLRFDTDLDAVAKTAELVIEAIPETMNLKKELFSKLGKISPEKTIFASNTSSLSISEMANVSGRADRFIGMHFFNPVHKMKLVELIMGDQTSEATLHETIEVCKQIGKETVQVKESPGFVTSRMNALIGNEAFRMLEEGIASATDIDKAIKLGLNHPMGPFEMVDLVGLDIRLSTLTYLHQTLGPLYKPSRILEEYVREGRLGRKVGRGVFTYDQS